MIRIIVLALILLAAMLIGLKVSEDLPGPVQLKPALLSFLPNLLAYFAGNALLSSL